MTRAETLPPEARLAAVLAPVERPLIREHSAKASGGALATGRFLVSFPRGALGPGPSRTLRGMLATLGAPPDAIAALDPHQSGAESVHFGLEPGPAPVLKCYLQFAEPPPDLPETDFLAIKWRADGRWTLSRYLDRRPLPRAAQERLIAETVPEGPVRAAMLAFLGETPAPALLEVIEPGTPRRSVDLNLYDAGLTLADRRDRLARFLGHPDYIDAHAADPLGHVAAGTGRDGAAFATLYHGARGVTGALP